MYSYLRFYTFLLLILLSTTFSTALLARGDFRGGGGFRGGDEFRGGDYRGGEYGGYSHGNYSDYGRSYSPQARAGMWGRGLYDAYGSDAYNSSQDDYYPQQEQYYQQQEQPENNYYYYQPQ